MYYPLFAIEQVTCRLPGSDTRPAVQQHGQHATLQHDTRLTHRHTHSDSFDQLYYNLIQLSYKILCKISWTN